MGRIYGIKTMFFPVQIIIKKILDKISNCGLKFSGIKAKTVCPSFLAGFDFDFNGMRMVEIIQKGKETELINFFEVDYADDLQKKDFSFDQIRESLSSETWKLDGRFVNSIIKGLNIKLEFKKFPYVDNLELEKIVESEKEKHNIKNENILSDYVVLGEAEEKQGKKLLVLIVSVPKKNIYKLIALLESFTLEPYSIEISSIALSRLLNFNEDLKQDTYYIVVNIQSREVEVSLNKGYQLCQHRSFYSSGSSDITKAIADELNIDTLHAEKIRKEININTIKDSTSGRERQIFSAVNSVLEKRMTELERSIQYFLNSYPFFDIEKIFLTGMNLTEGMDLYINNFVKLPVEIINPFKKINSGNFDVNNKIKASSFSLCTGLALKGLVQ